MHCVLDQEFQFHQALQNQAQMQLQRGGLLLHHRVDCKNVAGVVRPIIQISRRRNLVRLQMHREIFRQLHTLRCDCRWTEQLFHERDHAKPIRAMTLQAQHQKCSHVQ